MHSLITHFLGLLAYNLSFAVLAYVFVYFLRRKERKLTAIRGTAVALLGWVAGSLVVQTVHFLFALGGLQLQGHEEGPISIIALLSVMYPMFGWLSIKRTETAL